MTLTMTDLFCGAGGSTDGGRRNASIEVRMAANHWPLAVETHNRNFPDTDHDVADISQVEPRRYPRTDLLWASPECTKHSRASGRRRATDAQPDLFGETLPDEAAVRSRATMWDVLRFAEVHRYAGIVVENVLEAAEWELWPAWVVGLTALGYRHRIVSLNSMHAQASGDGAPQSRDRLYVVAWRGNRAPDLDRWTRPRAWCPSCDATVAAVQAWKPARTIGRYRAQYVYQCPTCRREVTPAVLPAAVAIDWTLPGQRIGDRRRPLAPNTIARIETGLARYVRPLLVPVEGRDGVNARSVDAPSRTQTGRCQDALVVPLRGNCIARPAATNPTPTIVAAGNAPALVVPLRNNGVARPASTDPVPTVAARGNHHALVYGYDTGQLRPVTEPLPTQTTVEGDALLGTAVQVDDCTFRMLEPHEIQAAMAFDSSYVVLGNKRERVRQLGNAVTPPAARDLIAALAEVLA